MNFMFETTELLEQQLKEVEQWHSQEPELDYADADDFQKPCFNAA